MSASSSGSSTGADTTSTGPSDDSAGGSGSTGTSTGTLRDVGTAADFGTGQPIGCKGKVDLLFVISRLGTMSTEQVAAAVALWTCGGGQEAHFGAVLVESSVGDKTMDVDIQTEVTAQSLDYCEHAGTERLHGGEAVALLHRPAHVLHHCPREALRDRGQQRLVVTQAHGQRPREQQRADEGVSSTRSVWSPRG